MMGGIDPPPEIRPSELDTAMRPSFCDPILLCRASRRVCRLLLLMGASFAAWGMASGVARAGGVDFGRDVLPILSENCFLCHGPDAASRKANLRLDLKDHALRAEEPVIVPGKGEESELIIRILSDDADE